MLFLFLWDLQTSHQACSFSDLRQIEDILGDV